VKQSSELIAQAEERNDKFWRFVFAYFI